MPSIFSLSVLLTRLLTVIFIMLVGMRSVCAADYDAQPTNPSLTSPVIQADTKLDTKKAQFVDEQQCLRCHENAVQHWQSSHHAKAMQPANDKTVLGHFDNQVFTDSGVSSRFFKRAGRYFIHTEGETGEYADFEVKYTFGVHPLQQYLLALPKGRLQAFTVAWDVEKQQWFDLYPNERIHVHDPLHWTKRGFNANSSCIDCHTTNMQLKFDTQTADYHTSWDALNVACQACHGNGSLHLEWAERQAVVKGEDLVQSASDSSSQRAPQLAEDKSKSAVPSAMTHDVSNNDRNKDNNDNNKGLVVDYDNLDTKAVTEICARCHSRRTPIRTDYSVGEPYLDHFIPELLRQDRYHADGQILDEVFVYGSFTQSKMYHAGVGCMDCHNPHSLQPHQTGNALCVSCHQEKPPTHRFAGLSPKNYDTHEHHFHPMGSIGAQCVNCHMPATTYMQIDARRDHQFVIPRPDLSKKWQTPNACTDCHQDKSHDWAITAMNKWYKGEKWQHRDSIAPTLTQAKQAEPEALQGLLAILANPNQAAMVRATAAELLAGYGQAAQQAQIQYLHDQHPLVRASILQSLEQIDSQPLLAAIKPLLLDKMAVVRMEAARLLAGVDAATFKKNEQQAFDVSLQAYKKAQSVLADHPEGAMNLGNLAVQMRDVQAAKAAYEMAIQRDALFMPAYQRLGQVYYALGDKTKAKTTFEQALQHTAQVGNRKAGNDVGQIHYALALLLAELKETEKALQHLKQATELMPNHAQVFYNYGMLLQKQQKWRDAEQALLTAKQLMPNNQRTIHALIRLYKQQGQTGKAQALMP
ncbi:MAG: tetratricopeptide repeat protein [bacterium]